MESGDLVEFGGLQKNLKRGEWLTSMPIWVDRPAQKEEGRQKLDRHSMGARHNPVGGGRNTIFEHRIDPNMWIMERLDDMTGATH